MWAKSIIVWCCVAHLFISVALGALLSPTEEVYPRGMNTKVTLYVRGSRVSIPLESEANQPQKYFEYSGRFYEMEDTGPLLPGPTLHVVPGGKIRLTLFNELEGEAVAHSSAMMYTFHNPNLTNVHFHGLHSDPKIDDPFKTADPGQNLSYKLPLVRDHVPGLHWYHCHSHGAVYQQLMGGLFGAIVVEEGSFMASPIHPFRGVQTYNLLMHLYRLTASTHCDGMTMEELDVAMSSNLSSSPKIVDKSGKSYPLPPDLYLVNGQHRPSVPVAKSSVTVLRLGYAAGSCHVNLTLPKQCEFHITAYDGVAVYRTKEVTNHWLYFTTATRIAVATVCHEVGRFPVRLSDDPNEVLFYISVTDGGSAGGKGKSKGKSKGKGKGKSANAKKETVEMTFPVTMPRYAADYLYLSGARKVKRDISFSQRDLPVPKPYYVIGQGTDCSSLDNSSTCYYEHFMGSMGNDPANYHGFAVPLHSVITARVFGDPTDPVPHPLHFHVNHFQFISFTPRPGGQHYNHTMEMYGVYPGQFRDTIPILDGVTVIRWQAATYLGEVVYHCHALHHEDRGMMVSYLVYPDPSGFYTKEPPQQVHAQRKRRHWMRLLLVLILIVVGILAYLCVRYVRSNPDPAHHHQHRASHPAASAAMEGESIPLLPVPA